jgi:hypothetical protein
MSKRKSPNVLDGRSNKKQKIDDYQSIEITKKTSYKHNEQQPQTPFGPKDILEINGSFFVSNDDAFKKLQEKENKRYNDSIIINQNNKKKKKKKKKKKNDLVNKMNLTLADLLNNDESEESENEGGHSHSSPSSPDSSSSSSSSSSPSSSQQQQQQLVPVSNSNEDSDDSVGNDIVCYNNRRLLQLQNDNSSFKECFLCSWGNSAHDGIYSKQLEELKNIYIKYRAFTTEEDLANMLYLYFIENIWTPDSNMPLLTPVIAFKKYRKNSYVKCHRTYYRFN